MVNAKIKNSIKNLFRPSNNVTTKSSSTTAASNTEKSANNSQSSEHSHNILNFADFAVKSSNSASLQSLEKSPATNQQSSELNTSTVPPEDYEGNKLTNTPTWNTTRITRFGDEAEENDEDDGEEETKWKEVISLHHQYGIPLPARERKFTIPSLRTDRFIGTINKACLLRIACSRKIHLKDVNPDNLSSISDTSTEKTLDLNVRSITPQISLWYRKSKKPVRYNRTTEMRFLYSHLPQGIPKRFGKFEQLPQSKNERSTRAIMESFHEGFIDGVEYEIEEIKYDLGKSKISPDKKVSTPFSYKLTQGTLKEKRDREIALRTRRENRLKNSDKLPFRI